MSNMMQQIRKCWILSSCVIQCVRKSFMLVGTNEVIIAKNVWNACRVHFIAQQKQSKNNFAPHCRFFHCLFGGVYENDITDVERYCTYIKRKVSCIRKY